MWPLSWQEISTFGKVSAAEAVVSQWGDMGSHCTDFVVRGGKIKTNSVLLAHKSRMSPVNLWTSESEERK